MPFFDESGRAYREALEATKTAVYMVCVAQSTKDATEQLMNQVRHMAGLRATLPSSQLPSEEFEKLWAIEDRFILCARLEIGLRALKENSPHSYGTNPSTP